MDNSVLLVSPSPHIKSRSTTRTIMLDVIIALCPALIASVIIFGWRALLVCAVCVAVCVASEWAFEKICRRKVTVGDLSAIVTGLLLAFNLPVGIPLWQAAIGSVVAIVVVKQLFGGIGYNFANPAITSRIIMLLAFSDSMTTDEQNWCRILLLLNVPKASFYTSFFLREHILEGDAGHALDMYKGYRWEFKRRIKDDRAALQSEGYQEPKYLLRNENGAPVVRGWEYYGAALRTLYSFELADPHKAPNLRTVDSIDLKKIAQLPTTAYFDFLRAWLDLVKDVPVPMDELLPEVKPFLKLLPSIKGRGKGDVK